jgi:branched-chain amino acid transport system substrate-binding protein
MDEKSKKMVTTIVVVIVVIAIIAGILAYYYSQPSQEQPSEPIKIGFFAPLTGEAAADGKSALHGAQIAVDYINEHGGVLGRELELVYYDDQLSPDQAIAIAHKLIEEDQVVAAVSGSYSGTTLAASSIYNEEGVPLVDAYAVNPDITRDKPYVFRVGMMGETEGKAAGYAAVHYFKASRIAILYIDNPFGVSLFDNAKAQAEKMGAQVVYSAKFSFPTTDFTSWLTEAKDSNIDLLMIFGYYQHAVAIKQARDLGIDVPILGCEGFDSPKLMEIAGDYANGVVIVTDLNRDSDKDFVQEFLSKYEEVAGMPADMVAASSYDAVLVLAKAIEKAGSTDPQKITDALKSLTNIEGATGMILKFKEGGNAEKYITLQEVKNLEFHFYAEITDPEIITPSF